MRIMKALALIFLCMAPVRGVAQTAAKESPAAANTANRYGAITGRVVDDAGRPIAGAPFFVIKAGVKNNRGAQNSAADDEGNFRVTGLAPGSYRISINVPGYVFARADSERDYYRPGDNVTINLIKGGVITGRVTDQYGEPMVGVRVFAVKVRELEGGQKYSGGLHMTNGKLTDDRGVYRLYGLEPGGYVIGASNDQGGFYGGYAGREAMTWHPSSPRATATEITVRSGEEISGADIRHREERGHMISGTVIGETASDAMSEGASILLTNEAGRQLIDRTWMRGAKSFVIFGVLDGEYEVTAFRQNSRENDLASSTPRRVVVSGADVSGLELKIAPPASISGRVKIETSAEGQGRCEDAAQVKNRASAEEVLLSATPEDESQSSIQSIALQLGYFDNVMGGAPNENGEFTLGGLNAGRFRITADLPDDGWYIRAITQPSSGAAKKPIDAARNGITLKSGERLSGVEVVLAEGAASLKGSVVPANEGARLPSRMRVHLIPAEVSAADDVTRYAETMIRGDGSFEFKHMAPGKYLLHTRQAMENDANGDKSRPIAPLAMDAVERAKLRREAAAAKNEIELKPCQRVKEQVLRLNQ
ncbi:MAG TPA: carboxypeptidase-like regulatory domain-containing protein [Blastocatellia bacterium]|nr:carboxypeptidase-like regulatory domain-containing protein [Blastocatellia bacterium]